MQTLLRTAWTWTRTLITLCDVQYWYSCNHNTKNLTSNFLPGHEASFAAFLCCLFKLRVLDQSDCAAIVFKVFQRLISAFTQIYYNLLDIIKDQWSVFDQIAPGATNLTYRIEAKY